LSGITQQLAFVAERTSLAQGSSTGVALLRLMGKVIPCNIPAKQAHPGSNKKRAKPSVQTHANTP